MTFNLLLKMCIHIDRCETSSRCVVQDSDPNFPHAHVEGLKSAFTAREEEKLAAVNTLALNGGCLTLNKLLQAETALTCTSLKVMINSYV